MGRTKWNVESIHTPSFPALHYFVYIPPHHLSPLLIDMETDTASTSTAFILPRWGGVVIANDLSAADATISNFDHVMAQVLGQVRSLFGFPIPAWAEPSSHITQVPSTVGAADWEINFIKRQRLYYNYISGAEQLRILMKLLDDNRQLPVTVHVAKLVQQSVDSLENCLTSAKSRSYNDAYNYCLVGYNAAYSAFFDETMLPLLYFPDEHVYAVYMPYFVPIAMPILSRIGEIFKLLKSRMKAQ
uniref:GPI transamidase component PIG-S n=2 Tax=Spongospora subterranea TaxID=70186 RepID=A0A0H5QIV5_9EUKA|eukprot:CRZ01236.1 hypothetical protein [Spongospora subterranea]